MKQVNSLIPFWDFKTLGNFTGKFLGDYQSANGKISAKQFEQAKSGDVYLIGGAVVNRASLVEGFYYLIKSMGQVKLTTGNNIGKMMNSYEIFQLDDNELADLI